MSSARTKFARVRAKLSILTRIQSSLTASRSARENEDHHSEIPESWKESFENLLSVELGVRAFTKFLQKEHSEENIQFWVACTNYAAISDQERRGEEANRIYEQFLSESASDPVNVDSQALKLVRDDLRNPTQTTFEVARKQIFILMKTDSYRRFLKSETCTTCDKHASGTGAVSLNPSPKPLQRLREKLKEVSGSSSSSTASIPSHKVSQHNSRRLVLRAPKHNLSTGDLHTLEESYRSLQTFKPSNGAIKKVLRPRTPEETYRVDSNELKHENSNLVSLLNMPYELPVPIQMEEKENSEDILGITIEENLRADNMPLSYNDTSAPTHTKSNFKIISDEDLQSAISEVRALTTSMKEELVKSVQPNLVAIRQRCSMVVSSFEQTDDEIEDNCELEV